MAQMVYVEVALGVEMDRSNIPTSFQSQQKPNLHHKISWSIKSRPNLISSPFGTSEFKQSLVMPTPINVSFDAHDDEVDIDHDFFGMFENGQTN
jgi:hypothetical protein